MKELLEKIMREVRNYPRELEPYRDLLSACLQAPKEEQELAHRLNAEARKLLMLNIRDMKDIPGAHDQYEKQLLFDARTDFDCYMLYLEKDRSAKERFYQPRRKILRPLVQAMQDLVDDKLDELFLSLPARVGKTTLAMFYTTWLMGRNPESSNLYSAYSGTITGKFYDGILELIQDKFTYKWAEVFGEMKIAATNAMESTIDIARKKHYPSLTARSLYGTLNGACDCNGILIADDLIGGIEEAMNKDRLVSAWAKVDNNLLPRKKEFAKLMWIGTRWSDLDPIGIRLDLIENDPHFKGLRWRYINTPALNEKDESNFEYDYGVGFSTEYYAMRRASFERNNDLASWFAQYMGQPIEREGTLLTPEDLRYYNGTLPDGDPDAVFMAVDPAFGGGDFVASPVCVVYGDDIFVHDVVYSNGDKLVTQPMVAETAIRNGVGTIQFEATKSTVSYKEGVDNILLSKGYRVNSTSKPAPNTTSKAQRIYERSPDIRERMIFRESGCRNREYSLFMQNVFSYKIRGKNKNDDAIDSLAMAIDVALGKSRKPVIFRRLGI